MICLLHAHTTILKTTNNLLAGSYAQQKLAFLSRLTFAFICLAFAFLHDGKSGFGSLLMEMPKENQNQRARFISNLFLREVTLSSGHLPIHADIDNF